MLNADTLSELEALEREANESCGPLSREGAYTPAIERLKTALDANRQALLRLARRGLLAEEMGEALRTFGALAGGGLFAAGPTAHRGMDVWQRDCDAAIERLRDLLRDKEREGWLADVAADEIERLRAEVTASQRLTSEVRIWEPCKHYGRHDEAECQVCANVSARGRLVLDRDALRSRLARAQEALEFYADPENWKHVEGHNLGSGALLPVTAAIDRSDVREGGIKPAVGGKRAREALAYLKGEGNG